MKLVMLTRRKSKLESELTGKRVQVEELGERLERDVGYAGRRADLEHVQEEASVDPGETVLADHVHDDFDRGLRRIAVRLQACAREQERVDEQVAQTGRYVADDDLLDDGRLLLVGQAAVALLQRLVRRQIDARRWHDGDRVGQEAAVEGAHAVLLERLIDTVGYGLEFARVAEVHERLDRFERVERQGGDEAGEASAHELVADVELLAGLRVDQRLFELLVRCHADGVLGRSLDHVDQVAAPQALPLAFQDHVTPDAGYGQVAVVDFHALDLEHRSQAVDGCCP